MKSDIDQAVRVLNKGGIVIFPTDTAFGMGCRMDNAETVDRLFKVRKRPNSQPTLVLVDSIEMAQKYLKPVDDRIKKLIKKYWPGALTIVLPCLTNKVSKLIRGGGNTLGVRMPDHKIALSLVKGVGVPMLGPSANFHGEKTPYKFEDLDPRLIEQVDYVVSGDTSFKKIPSTVIDCSKKPWKIIRKGAVKLDLRIKI